MQTSESYFTDDQPPKPHKPITLEQFYLGCMVIGMVATGRTEFDKQAIDSYKQAASTLAQYTREIDS